MECTVGLLLFAVLFCFSLHFCNGQSQLFRSERVDFIQIALDFLRFPLVLIPQDEANKHGGKWIIRLKKGLASRCWENLILAMLGEQFMVGEEICGAVISIRFQVKLSHIESL